MDSLTSMWFLSIINYSNILKIKIKIVYVKDFLISTKDRLKRVEHLYGEEPISSEPTFSNFCGLFFSCFYGQKNHFDFLKKCCNSNEFQIEQKMYLRDNPPRDLFIMTLLHTVCRKSYKSPKSWFVFYWVLMLIFHRWGPNVNKLPSTLYKSINLEWCFEATRRHIVVRKLDELCRCVIFTTVSWISNFFVREHP